MDIIIIFGLSSGGLFLLRELSQVSKNVFAIGRGHEIGQSSKYGAKYIAETEEELKEIVESIINTYGEKPKAFIESAYYLTMILERIPEFYSIIDFYGPDINLLRIFENKIKTYELLGKYNISVLPTYHIHQVDKIQRDQYPLILKWNSTELNKDKKIIKKTMIINSRDDLDKILNVAHKISPKLILQKYISIDFKDEYGYGGYFKNGEVRLEILMKAIRQYPMGIYSFAREIEETEVSTKIKKDLRNLLKDLNYDGFIHFDIKVKSETEDYYIIDVNPRPWGSMKILKKKYKNLPLVFTDEKNKISERHEIVQWVNLSTDFLSILSSAIKKRSFISIINDYKEYFKAPLITDIIQWNDLRVVFGLVKLALKKLQQGLRRDNRKG